MPVPRTKIGYRNRRTATSSRQQIEAALSEVSVMVAGTALQDYIPKMNASKNSGYEYIRDRANNARAWAFGKCRMDLVKKLDELIKILEQHTAK